VSQAQNNKLMRMLVLLGLIAVMAEATLLGQTQAMFTVTVTKPENGTIAISPDLP